jgi:type II secretory pathway pseudopilin PulG
MKGLTLLELLIVIGIIVVLLGVTIAALNPARQMRQAVTATRWANVSAIANAVAQKIINDGGSWVCANCPATTTPVRISSTACNLCSCLVPDYLGSLPSDPAAGSPAGQVTNCGSSYDTFYDISWSTTTSGAYPRVTVTAAQDTSISVTR